MPSVVTRRSARLCFAYNESVSVDGDHQQPFRRRFNACENAVSWAFNGSRDGGPNTSSPHLVPVYLNTPIAGS